MNSMERHEQRYRRRKAARSRRASARCAALGGVADVFSYHALFFCGKQCCNGVRWKQSTQRLESHLFSGTAKRRRKLLDGMWKPGKTVSFPLLERGKLRQIDAPHIEDRQVEKCLCQRVLAPLYSPGMIYDNGASQKGKGLRFSQSRLREQLQWHYRHYGREGAIVLADLHHFFPSAPHAAIYARHRLLILEDELRRVADAIIDAVPGGIGMPLGVEPSQLEMVSMPSSVDQWMKCGQGIHGAGHYMDDYYAILPTVEQASAFEAAFMERMEAIGLTINRAKCHVVPLTNPFRYCKAKFTLTETGGVKVNGNRDSMVRARRKLNASFPREDVDAILQSQIAYFKNYDDHGRVLKLKRIYHAIYGGEQGCIKSQKTARPSA